VGQLTPDWNEDQSNEVMDGKFRDAMALTGKEFEEAVLWIGKVGMLCGRRGLRMGVTAMRPLRVLQKHDLFWGGGAR